jgi:hypothetical protein
MPFSGKAKGLHDMTKQVVLLRVGIDSGCGRTQGPLFKDGSFDFVCISASKQVIAHTYGNIIGRHGRPHADYLAESRRKIMAEQHVHDDPEWETFTYGDPTIPKRSLRNFQSEDILVFYCGLQKWDTNGGWNLDHRPALYLASCFVVALAGMAVEFDKKILKAEFGMNFYVRYRTVFEKQKEDLVLVKGGPGSRLLKKSHQISTVGKDRAGKPLKVLSPTIQKVFASFGGHISIQPSPLRWVESGFVDKAIRFVTGLE